MATIQEARLTHEERHPRVLFTVGATVAFEEQELGHDWLFEVTLMEDDPLSDDRLKRERYYFESDGLRRCRSDGRIVMTVVRLST